MTVTSLKAPLDVALPEGTAVTVTAVTRESVRPEATALEAPVPAVVVLARDAVLQPSANGLGCQQTPVTGSAQDDIESALGAAMGYDVEATLTPKHEEEEKIKHVSWVPCPDQEVSYFVIGGPIWARIDCFLMHAIIAIFVSSFSYIPYVGESPVWLRATTVVANIFVGVLDNLAPGINSNHSKLDKLWKAMVLPGRIGVILFHSKLYMVLSAWESTSLLFTFIVILVGAGVVYKKATGREAPATHSELMDSYTTWAGVALHNGSETAFILKELPALWPASIKPPRPFGYTTFMEWVRRENFTALDGLKWLPEWTEFDIDAASTGKFGPFLKGPDGAWTPDSATSVKVSKGINTLPFLDHIFRQADVTSIGSPGTHLYVISKLLGGASGRSKPTFVDAGCGPGFLLLAWVLGAGDNSRAIGIDLEEDNVMLARRNFISPVNTDVLDTKSLRLPENAQIKAYVGDALAPDTGMLGLVPGTVDAINVGVAVRAMADLKPLAGLLRPGGLLLAPYCKPLADQAPGIPKGKCDALLELFRKGADGSPTREPSDPDVPVRFIAPERTAAAFRLRGHR